MTALFLAGTCDTLVRSLVKPNIEEETSFCFPLRNNAGISGSFALSVPTSVMFLVKKIFASSQLVRKLLMLTPVPVPYV
jgi:hypothetical protein